MLRLLSLLPLGWVGGEAANAQAPLETFPFEEVVRPRTITKPECDSLNNAVWVDEEWQERRTPTPLSKSARGCIRYFASNNAERSDTALIYLHGDVLSDRRTDKERYEKNANSAIQTSIAQRMSDAIGLPVIRLGRPGTFGSTGMRHAQRRLEIEAQLVNAAVSAIKERYHYSRIQLAGLSGGGGLVGALLTLGRDDIDCAVVGSGATSVKSRQRDFNPERYAKGLDQTGNRLSDVFDPVDHVSFVRPDPGRRIFILGDPRDAKVSFASQREFHSRLVEAGISATLLTAAAVDVKHHDLSAKTQQTAAWCKAGLSDTDIQKRLLATTASSGRP